jgi:hypothetical protein
MMQAQAAVAAARRRASCLRRLGCRCTCSTSAVVLRPLRQRQDRVKLHPHSPTLPSWAQSRSTGFNLLMACDWPLAWYYWPATSLLACHRFSTGLVPGGWAASSFQDLSVPQRCTPSCSPNACLPASACKHCTKLPATYKANKKQLRASRPAEAAVGMDTSSLRNVAILTDNSACMCEHAARGGATRAAALLARSRRAGAKAACAIAAWAHAPPLGPSASAAVRLQN